MQCYTELLPPSGVTDALSLPFLSATSSNLVVAKTSLLQVFDLVNVPHGPVPTAPEEKSRPQFTKLVLVSEYKLPGIIAGLGRVKLLDSKSGGEAVLVAVRDAKLALIEWDPEQYRISTISIHYYEKETVYTSPWAPDLASCPSYLSVDPNSRCAVLNFGLRNLAVLPFHQVGDDLVMDDYDPDLDGERPEGADQAMQGSGKSDMPMYQTPYVSSFVLPLTALEPSIIHPISLAFLYEYREPTFGVLYSQVATSSSLLHERKDVVCYSVFTLDLEQRASTTILSTTRLPSDLFKVVALPPPVGGALLIGSNELVHIDQAGKTNAVGVNEFARQASAFSMADQADLELRLEGCLVEHLGTEHGDMVLALTNGKMVVVSFKLDGRTVSGLTLRPTSDKVGGSLLRSGQSCSAPVGPGKIFFGSEESDAVLLGWSRYGPVIKKERTDDAGLDGLSDMDEEEEEGEDEYEDDLYSASVAAPAAPQNGAAVNGVNSSEYVFRVHDRLWNLGPMSDITLGRPPGARDKERSQQVSRVTSDLELITTHGYGRAGGITVLKQELIPSVIDSMKINDTVGAWSVHITSSPKSKHEEEKLSHSQNGYDQYLVLSKSKGPNREESVVYIMGSGGLEETKASEFNPNEDVTVDIGVLANRSRVVQVLKNEIRSYDSDLVLSQIYPVWDEDTSEEALAVNSTFADPFLLVTRNDQSILLLQADESGDLDEIPLEGIVQSTKWISGSIYHDTQNFSKSSSEHAATGQSTKLFLFLLSSDGKLMVFCLPDISHPVYTVEGVDFLPQSLNLGPPPRRSSTREHLTEMMIADLGDSISSSPHLILRTRYNDLIIYEPYFATKATENPFENLRFLKSTTYSQPKSSLSTDQLAADGSGDQLARPLRAMENVCGYKTVSMTGESPCFIIKSSTTLPQVVRLGGKAVYSLGTFHVPACEKGFVYVDIENIVRMCRFPGNTRFNNSWAARKIFFGEQIDFVEYSSSSETYVLGTSHRDNFKLPENDEVHPEWQNEDISFLPQNTSGSVKLVSPRTWSVIDRHDLNMSERVMCLKSLSLEVSENTWERKDLIAVGTSIVRGEDIPPRGCIYVFEVIEVVPEVNRPETNRKLKLVAKEEVKGAVTSLSGIGGQGFLIVAQGQKCMVRGLKEDGSLLPVAFMDMQCYVSVIKELKGTGMCIMGDALKGIWFTGYSEEPYKLTLFGKDIDGLPVIAADFLPDGKKLYILVSDDNCNIHVLQYDPEDPGSSKGDRLLERSTFHTGHYTSTLTLLPRSTQSPVSTEYDPDAMETDITNTHQILITSQSGSVALITPVAEESYRRLSALQAQLVNTLEHPCGLNPRAFRAVESDGIGGRGVIDGDLLCRWLDLSVPRKTEIASRVGADIWSIQSDLESVGWSGLGYL